MHEGQVFDSARKYEVTEVQRRAIVMVAFHVFLAIYRSQGHEDEFEDVRSFILGDGRPWGPLSANPDNPTQSPLGPLRDECPTRPKHVFGIGKSEENQVMVCLRLFANEENSTWWQVLLASNERRPIQPCIGATVYYEDEPHQVGGRVFDGFVVRPIRDGKDWVIRCDE